MTARSRPTPVRKAAGHRPDGDGGLADQPADAGVCVGELVPCAGDFTVELVHALFGMLNVGECP